MWNNYSENRTTKPEVKILIDSRDFIDPDCLCSLVQGEDCFGTPVKVQKTESTAERDMA